MARKRAISQNRFEDHYKVLNCFYDPPQNTWHRDQCAKAIEEGRITEEQVWGLNDSDSDSRRIYAIPGWSSNFMVSTFVVTERPWASYEEYAVWV